MCGVFSDILNLERFALTEIASASYSSQGHL